MVDQRGIGKAPQPAIPAFVPRPGIGLEQRGHCADRLGHGPPIAVGPRHPCVEIQRIGQPAPRVPGIVQRRLDQQPGLPGGVRAGPARQIPPVQQQPRHLERMAGGGARRAEHGVAFIAAVGPPVGIVMFGDAPALRCGLPGDEEIEDAPCAMQVFALARGLVRGQQRLDPVHVGVHAAIGRKDLPVAGEFVREPPCVPVPEPLVQNGGDVGQQPVSIGMPRQPGRGGGQHHEDMAIGQLGPVGHRAVPDPPDIAAVPPVAMDAPQQVHAPVDDARPVGPPGHPGQSIGMDQPRRDMQLQRAVRQGPAVLIQHPQAAVRARAGIEKRQGAPGIANQEIPVDGVVQPADRAVRAGFCVVHGAFPFDPCHCLGAAPLAICPGVCHLPSQRYRAPLTAAMS